MLILIAESKSMSATESVTETEATKPIFDQYADDIMGSLRDLSVGELATRFKLGPKNASRLREEIYDFPDKTTGCIAGTAFTGVVFRSLDVTTLPESALADFNSQVRIVSSLYGLLRPTDIIKPYRFDFGSKAAPLGKPLNSFWQPLLTDALKHHLHATGEREILNLLPLDASKCFNWKEISSVAEMRTAEFRQVTDGGKIVTPHSERLKRLRGSLLRYILLDKIELFKDLEALDKPELTFDPNYNITPSAITFLTA